MISVGVSFVGALGIVWWAVVRGVFGSWVSGEGGRGVGRESGDRETLSVRPSTKGGSRRWNGEYGLWIHDERRESRTGTASKWQVASQIFFSYNYHTTIYVKRPHGPAPCAYSPHSQYHQTTPRSSPACASPTPLIRTALLHNTTALSRGTTAYTGLQLSHSHLIRTSVPFLVSHDGPDKKNQPLTYQRAPLSNRATFWSHRSGWRQRPTARPHETHLSALIDARVQAYGPTSII